MSSTRTVDVHVQLARTAPERRSAVAPERGEAVPHFEMIWSPTLRSAPIHCNAARSRLALAIGQDVQVLDHPTTTHLIPAKVGVDINANAVEFAYASRR